MGWRFRQSFSIVPGLRLNLSKSGLSASIGSSPFTLNVGPHGLMGTASIPGTGLSYRHHMGTAVADAPITTSPETYHPHPTPAPEYINHARVEEIHSASTELLTSETLKQLKQLIQAAHQQHQEVSLDLDSARSAKARSQAKFDSWDQGMLLKKLLKKSFEKRRETYGTDSAKVAEYEEQLRLSTISTEIRIDKEQADLYYRLRDEFAALIECDAIWDVKTRQPTDQYHERTTAVTAIGRERVSFELGDCELIQWDQKVPHLRNAKGGELFLYPGFVLYRAAREAFSLIEYQEITGVAKDQAFHEDEKVPTDTKVIGSTWAKANKDGSRDRRFADNHQIPIVRYGSLKLTSDTGLWEEFQFSSVDKMVNWVKALNGFRASYAAIAK